MQSGGADAFRWDWADFQRMLRRRPISLTSGEAFFLILMGYSSESEGDSLKERDLCRRVSNAELASAVDQAARGFG